MSMQLMAYAMSLKVGNPLRKLVLLKLADNANDKGECFPSYQHIADQCEISRRAVMGHIQALEKAGYLKIKRRKNGKENQSNVFYLTLKKGGEPAALRGSELSAPPSERNAPPSEPAALGGSESGSPITSHSFEPVIEPTPLSNTEARDYTLNFFFDYGEVPYGIKLLRDSSLLPFVSYTYKAIPAVLRGALTRPHRFLAVTGLMYALNAMSYAMLGDDADEEEERKYMPEYMKGFTSFGTPKLIRLPWNDSQGKSRLRFVAVWLRHKKYPRYFNRGIVAKF